MANDYTAQVTGPSGEQQSSLRKLLHILYALYAIFW